MAVKKPPQGLGGGMNDGALPSEGTKPSLVACVSSQDKVLLWRHFSILGSILLLRSLCDRFVFFFFLESILVMRSFAVL